MKKIILTGERPTGPLHIGHYVGTLRNRIRIQNSNDFDEMYLFAADAQALTDNYDNPKKVRDNVFEVVLDNLACGIDPNRVNYFIQSEVPELTELTFYYMNLVTIARLYRNPTVKEEIKQKGMNESIPAGFFTYPVSQTADITAFKANIIPVGADQLPMIEQAREIVRKFNSIYGNVLVEPEALLPKTLNEKRLVGIDGNSKMSKSLNNCIYLKDSEEEIKRKVFSMYTEIWQVDDLLKMNIDLEGLSSISTEEYTENTDIMRDKVFQALKRFKWCKKIINVILSECTFDDGIEKVQEILRNNAKCKFNQSSIGVKQQVIKILDSHNRSAMILSFDRL